MNRIFCCRPWQGISTRDASLRFCRRQTATGRAFDRFAFRIFRNNAVHKTLPTVIFKWHITQETVRCRVAFLRSGYNRSGFANPNRARLESDAIFTDGRPGVELLGTNGCGELQRTHSALSGSSECRLTVWPRPNRSMLCMAVCIIPNPSSCIRMRPPGAPSGS